MVQPINPKAFLVRSIFAPGPPPEQVQCERKAKIHHELKSVLVKAHYQDRYKKGAPVPELQQATKLPNELIGKILQLRFPEALEELKRVEIALNCKQHSQPLSLEEQIAHNDARDEFQLATYFGTDLTNAQRGKLLHDALRLNTPRIYKKLQAEEGSFNRAIHHQDRQQFNLLSKALLTRHWGVADNLVERGVDVTQPDITGRSPIEWAALLGQVKLVEKMSPEIGDKMLPQEQKELLALSRQEEVPDATRQALKKIAETGRLDAEAVNKLEKIAKNTREAEAEMEVGTKTKIESITKRHAVGKLMSLAQSQGEAVHRQSRHPSRMPVGFNFGFKPVQNMSAEELEEQFNLGLASLAAGKDFHPPYASTMDWITATHFGKVLAECRPNANPWVRSAAHALIQSGVDVNNDISLEHTALTINRNPEILDALLEAGADLELLSKQRRASLLERHLSYDDPPTEPAFIQKLIDAGTKINKQNLNGSSPLLAACRQPTPDAALLLLERGAAPNLGYTSNDYKPIHCASFNNHAQLVEQLIQRGIPVNIQNVFFSKNTPLHLAAKEGHLETVNMLLKHQANADIPNRNGKTPRHLAETGLADSWQAATNQLDREKIQLIKRYRAILKAMNVPKRQISEISQPENPAKGAKRLKYLLENA